MKEKLFIILLSIFFIFTGNLKAGDLPDPNITPGSTNPAVTQDTINQTICVPNWTSTVRPRTNYTNSVKFRQINEYGFSDKEMGHYEEDHLISLQLGGHPSDERNLWPQHYDSKCGARIKDKLENRLKKMICSGKITLEEAQKEIANNWIDAYKKYFDKNGCE